MNKYLLLLFSLFFFNAYSQSTFQKTYGGTDNELGSSIQQTFDGGYIMAGSTVSFGAGNFDVYVIKTDDEGSLQWTRTFGGSGDDRGNDVKQTSDGGYIITGSTNSFGSGLTDIYLIKIDINGDSLWTKTIGNSNDDSSISIEQTDDGGYIIAAAHIPPSETVFRSCVIKTDANGNITWSKIFGHYFWQSFVSGVKQTNDGGYVLSGVTPGGDIMIVRMDNSGDTSWIKMYGATYNLEMRDILVTTDGGFILTGSYQVSFNDYDVYLLKLNAAGDTVWSRAYGSPMMESGISVFQESDQGYVVAGYTFGFGPGIQNSYLIRTDSSGILIWSKTFGTTGLFQNGLSVTKANDGGYVISGSRDSDICLIKTDTNGYSGCNELVAATMTHVPPLAPFYSQLIFSMGLFATNPPTQMVSGGIENIECFTSIHEPDFTTLTISIFPNPTSGELNYSIDVPIDSSISYTLYSFLGERIISNRILATGKGKFNFPDLEKGLYLLVFNSSNGSVIKKIIKI